jgi:hypothetical protein
MRPRPIPLRPRGSLLGVLKPLIRMVLIGSLLYAGRKALQRWIGGPDPLPGPAPAPTPPPPPADQAVDPAEKAAPPTAPPATAAVETAPVAEVPTEKAPAKKAAAKKIPGQEASRRRRLKPR